MRKVTKACLVAGPGSVWAVSEEGDVATTSQGQWKQIPHCKEAPPSLLPKERRFCHVHTAPNFPRNFWTWRSIPTESVGGKVQMPEISSNCFLKRSGCRKETWWWLQWGKVALRVPFSLSNGELTLWRSLKTTPLGGKKCSWRWSSQTNITHLLRQAFMGNLASLITVWHNLCATPELCSCSLPCHMADSELI